MIEFKPQIKDNLVIYTSHENNVQTGRVTLTLDTATRSTLHLVEADSEETAEGLIRSALTAAANRNIFVCDYIAENYKEVARRLGFTDNKDKLYGEIPFLLSGCCGCQHNKMS